MKTHHSLVFLFIYLILSIIATIFFFLLAHYIFTANLTLFQIQIHDWMISIQSPLLSKILIILTSSANALPILIFTCLLSLFLLVKQHRFEAGLTILTMLTLSLSNLLLKHWFARERPPFERLIEETGYSFPSGHSMMSFGMAILICYLVFHLSSIPVALIITLIGFSYAILIGVSRIYVHVHYLGDVLGGYFATTAITCLLFAIFEIIYRKIKRGNP